MLGLPLGLNHECPLLGILLGVPELEEHGPLQVLFVRPHLLGISNVQAAFLLENGLQLFFDSVLVIFLDLGSLVEVLLVKKLDLFLLTENVVLDFLQGHLVGRNELWYISSLRASSRELVDIHIELKQQLRTEYEDAEEHETKSKLSWHCYLKL